MYSVTVAAIHKLRVNLKSLSAEIQFIRQEESRCDKVYLAELYSHRKNKVREESRYTHLALAYIRGRRYDQVEKGSRKVVNPKRLFKKLAQYLPSLTETQVVAWLT